MYLCVSDKILKGWGGFSVRMWAVFFQRESSVSFYLTSTWMCSLLFLRHYRFHRNQNRYIDFNPKKNKLKYSCWSNIVCVRVLVCECHHCVSLAIAFVCEWAKVIIWFCDYFECNILLMEQHKRNVLSVPFFICLTLHAK